MPTYQGPHVAVTQQFVTSPGAIAIEDLPSVAVGTAFDVFEKEQIGSSYGIVDRELAWGADKVIFDKDAIDQKAFEFYPVKVFANSPFGNVDLELLDANLSSTGATLVRDKSYKVPDTEKIVGACEGIVPYYKRILTAGDVQIYAADLRTVVIVGGTVVTAQLRPGQKVFVTTDGGTSWTLVGTVGSIGNDETKIRLATPYTAPITTGDGIAVGAVSDTLIDIPDTIYDTTADFITTKIRVGDVVYISSLSIAASIANPIAASVVSIIDKNTLKFNTETLVAGQVDYEYLKYQDFTETPGSTIQLYTYWVERYAGFSQNYGIKLLNAGAGVAVGKVSSSVLTVPTAGFPIVNEGDVFIITTANVAAGSEERDVTPGFRPYRIQTITINGANYEITVDGTIYHSGVAPETEFSGGEFISIWSPKVETPVFADFRAVRSEELGVVKRIASLEDITAAWSKDNDISIHNELAFMAQIEFGLNRGKVMYGVNVDATEANITAQYAAAFDELKLYDVYCHALGTEDPGVNALAGPYVDGQSAPYEGHERIAVVAYDEDDIYLQGSDTGSVATTGLITIDGAFDPIAAGVTIDDVVKIYDSSGDFVDEVLVTETPTIVTQVQTDYSGGILVAGHSFRFQSGRKDDQSVRIGAIGYGNRRVQVVWPGWFQADFGGVTYTLPPYYISAAIAGMDGGIIVSQSFTNYAFSIPGLSNIKLDTNHYFRKLQLDEIGGGGVSVMIQDARISQTIKSRHDLTSNMDAVEYREHSITKQADVSAKTIRNAINPYVGKYNITPDLFRFIGQVCAIVSTKLVKEGVIARLSVLKIKRDEVIADKINITMEATVFVAGNYYDVTLIVVSR